MIFTFCANAGRPESTAIRVTVTHSTDLMVIAPPPVMMALAEATTSYLGQRGPDVQAQPQRLRDLAGEITALDRESVITI